MNPNDLRTRFRNLASTKTKNWYRIVNQAAGPTQIHIYDDIGFMGVTAQNLVDDLSAINGPVELRMNSGGGEIFEGIAIYNALCARDVAVYIDGIAASAASFIAMAASPGKLFMAKNASMMIHDGQAMAMGNAKDLSDLVDVLERESKKIASIYADRTGKTQKYFRNKMRKETWYDADQALEEGLVDKIFDPRTGSPVDKAKKLVNKSSGKSKDVPIGDGWYCCGDGHRFDPDNDGDDDSTPEGDTDHDYFDEDGKEIKPIPPMPIHTCAKSMSLGGKHAKKSKPRNADADNSEWDADRAWANGAASDDPAAFYNGICAGRKAGDPKTQGAHALPYKYHPDDPPNANGVRNALARFSSTEGLTNAAEAKKTLESAMKRVNPDWKPEDSMDGTRLLAKLLGDNLEGGKK